MPVRQDELLLHPDRRRCARLRREGGSAGDGRCHGIKRLWHVQPLPEQRMGRSLPNNGWEGPCCGFDEAAASGCPASIAPRRPAVTHGTGTDLRELCVPCFFSAGIPPAAGNDG
ncbi:hypothetical protein GCM10010339_38650 [Streptomyces alanosinicus]|uniref:Uncharacterized protein n=1 Tax=Streptomyces alanosinicus TaxID=68171 RepID=A0A918YJZ6_9ACTN|nr:hypothetical protein GCM10010339_38650 [Streptomyces alanosinicus]